MAVLPSLEIANRETELIVVAAVGGLELLLEQPARGVATLALVYPRRLHRYRR